MEAEAFYARIAAGLGGASKPLVARTPRMRSPEGGLSTAERTDALYSEYATRLQAVGGACERLPSSLLETRLRELVADAPAVRVASALLPRSVAMALPQALDCTRSSAGEWRAACAAAEWGITDAVALVAETGSVLLCAAKDRPRSASLLPRRHLVVASAARLVPALEDALAHLQDAPSQWLLVSGPSRTSDIENDLTIGVHGPGVLHVLVVDEERG